MAINVEDHEGVPVGCGSERWREKIERNHPELIGREGDVALAIADPDFVLQDRDYPERRHFVRRVADSLFLDAVVEYRYSHDGLRGSLVTAFLRSRLRRGDPVLYVRRRRDP